MSKPVNIDQLMELMAKLLGGCKVIKGADAMRAPDNSQNAHREIKPSADLSPIVSKLPAHNKKFKNIIIRFIKRLGQQLDAIEKAASGGDLKAVAELAHWLKGAGGTVGFDVFTEPAAQLERHAKNGDSTQLKPEIAKLKQLAARIVVPGDDIATASSSKTIPSKEMGISGSLSSNRTTDSVPKPVVSRLAKITRLQPTILGFVEKLDEKVARMEAALEKQDMTELAGLAHWLKGAGGTVGYDDLTKPAADLESSAKQDQVEMANQTLKEVKALARAIVPPVIKNEGIAGKETI
jgi:HPt (histidine-containing phosphotransfer) domain-containing protein